MKIKYLVGILILMAIPTIANAQYSQVGINFGDHVTKDLPLAHNAPTLGLSGTFGVTSNLRVMVDTEANWTFGNSGGSRYAALGRFYLGPPFAEDPRNVLSPLAKVLQSTFVEAGVTAFKQSVTTDTGLPNGLVTVKNTQVHPTVGVGYWYRPTLHHTDSKGLSFDTSPINVIAKFDYHISSGYEGTLNIYHDFQNSPFGVRGQFRLMTGKFTGQRGLVGEATVGFYINFTAISGY